MHFHVILVLSAIALVASGAVLSLAITRARLLRRLRELTGVVEAVGAGHYGLRTHIVDEGPLGGLANAVNVMCDRLQGARAAADAHLDAVEQLRHSERLSTLARLTHSVAEEFGNPLNVIQMRAQLIESGDTATLSEAQQNAAIIRAQARRMTRSVQDILSFARRQPARIARCDLAAVVHRAVALCEHRAKKHGSVLRCEIPKDAIEIRADERALVQAVVHLIVNGIQATREPGGVVLVVLQDRLSAPRNDAEAPMQRYACIRVTDAGEGVSDQSLPHLFEPFYSTRSPSEGAGMGLAVAQGIAKEHEGWITVESDLGKGSAFTLHLPRTQRGRE
jgi:two-component system NtrC family sensor kinase